MLQRRLTCESSVPPTRSSEWSKSAALLAQPVLPQQHAGNVDARRCCGRGGIQRAFGHIARRASCALLARRRALHASTVFFMCACLYWVEGRVRPLCARRSIEASSGCFRGAACVPSDSMRWGWALSAPPTRFDGGAHRSARKGSHALIGAAVPC